MVETEIVKLLPLITACTLIGPVIPAVPLLGARKLPTPAAPPTVVKEDPPLVV